MSYYINQNNPTDSESSNNNVPTGEVYNEEKFIEKAFEKCKHIGKDKLKLAITEMQKAIIDIMEEEGVDELPIVLKNGQTVYFSKPDTTAQPPNDQPQ